MSVISVKYIWVQNKSNQHWDLREKGYTFEHLTWNIWTLNLKHHHNLDFLFMGILGRFFLKLTLKILLKTKVVWYFMQDPKNLCSGWKNVSFV